MSSSDARDGGVDELATTPSAPTDLLAGQCVVEGASTLRGIGNKRVVRTIHPNDYCETSQVHNQSLFDNFTLQRDRFVDQQTAQIRDSKDHYRAGRAKPAPKDIYTPYACVKGRNLRSDLCHIAELLQYIDNGFAEYFQVVVLQLPLLTVERYLESARNKVEKKQAQSKHERRPDSPLNLGDLGNFCQKVFDRHMDCDRRRVSYETTDYLQEQMLNYLQDSFEIYYWQFMLDLFLQQSVNSRSLSATVVIRVLSSYKIEILHKTDVIRRHLAASGNKSGDEIEPLMKGIDARIAVLEGVWNKGMSDLEASDLFQSVFQAIKPGLLSPSPGVEPATPAQVFPAWPANQQSNPKDTIIFIILIAFFFVGSLIPCLLAFSIAQQTPGTGHITDADFWNLLQSSIMSILGSLMTMVPLMHGSRFSAAYAVTWLLWSAGVVCAIISVVLYLVCNPAFSSAVSYFGSIFSLMAVLATTQVVPRPAVSIGDKVK